MADHTWNMRKSIHNYDTYKYLELKNPQYLDWEITTIFYSACKLVDEQLVKKNIKPSSHTQRNRLVMTKFSKICQEYRLLYQLSRMPRYGPRVRSSDKANALKWYSVIKSDLAGRAGPHE